MTTTSLAGRRAPVVGRRPSPADRWLRGRVLARLSALRHGRLEIADTDGVRVVGPDPDGAARLEVLDPRFWRLVALQGNLGFAESYLRDFWQTSDLPAVLGFFARNVARNGGARWSSSAFANAPARLAHRARRNTRPGSRRNIREHYDLGNDFYALFLDDTMTYSCAFFERPDVSLRDASVAKLDRVCRKLGLRPGMRVLEIGTGWGSFALHAAGRFGCHVTTTTISVAQRVEAARRFAAAGLSDRIDLLDADYRDLSGRFDRLVSIEMIEAVGAENLPGFFGRCADLLADDGAFALQAITMPDRDWEAYLRAPDFIQRYVFPGSCVPSLGAIVEAVGRHTDLRVHDVESLGPHYAETLRRWRARFRASLDTLRAQGRPERFLRLWDYYLSYCEAGFEERYVDDVQMVLAKPGWRGVTDAGNVPDRAGPRP